MYIVQPGSATMKSKLELGVRGDGARAPVGSPTTASATRTDTSTEPSPGCATGAPTVSKPSPTTRTCVGSVQPA